MAATAAVAEISKAQVAVGCGDGVVVDPLVHVERDVLLPTEPDGEVVVGIAAVVVIAEAKGEVGHGARGPEAVFCGEDIEIAAANAINPAGVLHSLILLDVEMSIDEGEGEVAIEAPVSSAAAGHMPEGVQAAADADAPEVVFKIDVIH